MTDVSTARAPFAVSDSPTEPELVGKYFRALGDPTRIRILEQLAEHGELSVTELVALGRALLTDNAEHVAACQRIERSTLLTT